MTHWLKHAPLAMHARPGPLVLQSPWRLVLIIRVSSQKDNASSVIFLLEHVCTKFASRDKLLNLQLGITKLL